MRYIGFWLKAARAIFMKLRFDGQAVAVAGGVNFAGYVEDQPNRRHDVLCRVTAEALRILACDCGATPEELIAAYRSVSETVNLLAAAQYAAGEPRPCISSVDIPPGWSKLAHRREAG
jgi:hypothetical protein